jgi:hypothetical protein
MCGLQLHASNLGNLQGDTTGSPATAYASELERVLDALLADSLVRVLCELPPQLEVQQRMDIVLFSVRFADPPYAFTYGKFTVSETR